MAVESTARNPAVDKALAALPASLWTRVGLTPDSTYEAVDRFLRYDKDKSGALNKGELVELLVELFRDRMTRANVERVANLQVRRSVLSSSPLFFFFLPDPYLLSRLLPSIRTAAVL